MRYADLRRIFYEVLRSSLPPSIAKGLIFNFFMTAVTVSSPAAVNYRFAYSPTTRRAFLVSKMAETMNVGVANNGEALQDPAAQQVTYFNLSNVPGASLVTSKNRLELGQKSQIPSCV